MENSTHEIFTQLKNLLTKYEKPLVIRDSNETNCHFWSEKNVIVLGRKYKEFYFAGLKIHSNYVGFYFMPVYIEPELKKQIKPELLKLMKGKSCFHIKNLDVNIETQIAEVLEIGMNYYKKSGLI